MNRSRHLLIALLLCANACGHAFAQSKAKAGGKAKSVAKPKPATPPPAATPAKPTVKLESFIMLPEPKVMRTERSRLLPDAKKTVMSPAYETTESPGVKTFTAEEFSKLGISVETFLERARETADRRLAGLTPEYVKDDAGRLRYAVYRGESPLIASLLIAPSLATFFQKTFGGSVWAVLPDRHSLYLFPARPDALAEFTVDLRDRYDGDPYAASPEIFLLGSDGTLPRVVGTFAD